MAKLIERIDLLAGAIRDKLNLVTPRLPPAGGLTDQVLAKASDATASYKWTTVSSGASPTQAFTPISTTGNGSSGQTIMLPVAGLTPENVVLIACGVHQRPTTDYTISGTTLTIVDAVASGDSIIVRPQLGAQGLQGPAGSGSGVSYPIGGSTGQVLAKASAADGDVSWQDHVSAWPVCIVGRDGGSSTGFQSMAPGAFITVELGNNAFKDTHGGWNSSTHEYTIQQTGTYQVSMILRLVDNSGAVNHGVNFGPNREDSAFFGWDTFPTTSTTNRFSNRNFIVSDYTAGTKVKLFAYVDSGSNAQINKASFTLVRIR